MKSVPIIGPNSITGLTGLKIRPVFFVKLNGEAKPSLVIKGESSGVAGMAKKDMLLSIQWGSKLMKNVNNPQVNTKLMVASEVQEFKRAAGSAFAMGSEQAVSASRSYTWVKMPMVAGLSDAEYYRDDNTVDTESLRVIIPKLMDQKVWYDLGEVLAVDIFTGNNDRFDTTDGAWVNNGNVMFLDGGSTSVIGLDTFDPNSREMGDLGSKGGYEGMKSLISDAIRHEFAGRCTKSVGKKLSGILKRFGGGKAIISIQGEMYSIDAGSLEIFYYAKYTTHLSDGIAAGADKLKTYLQAKVKQPAYVAKPTWVAAQPRGRVVIGGSRTKAPTSEKTMPQGILDRMKYLGW